MGPISPAPGCLVGAAADASMMPQVGGMILAGPVVAGHGLGPPAGCNLFVALADVGPSISTRSLRLSAPHGSRRAGSAVAAGMMALAPLAWSIRGSELSPALRRSAGSSARSEEGAWRR
jgi:hypothetical protein